MALPNSFPNMPVIDTFDNLGPQWTTPWDAANAVQASSGVLGCVAHDADVRLTTAQAVADCEAYVTLAALPTSSIGLFLRGNAARSAYIRCSFAFSAGQYGVAVDDTNGNSNSSGAFAANAADKFGVSVVGNKVKAWYFNGSTWALKASITTTILAPGYIGINFTDTDTQLDDFGGGSISAQSGAYDFVDVADAVTVGGYKLTEGINSEGNYSVLQKDLLGSPGESGVTMRANGHGPNVGAADANAVVALNAQRQQRYADPSKRLDVD